MYKKICSRTISSLKSISGEDAVLTSESGLLPYAEDESRISPFPPEAVVRPSSPEQIAEIIKLAAAEKFPVTPRGGGTSLSGGPLAVMGGLILSYERLNRVKDLDHESRMAVVEPGVINAALQAEAEKQDLFYPVNPASMDTCTIGGNVAASTGGANTVRYGTTRNYLTGIKAVDGSGASWKSGGGVIKNSTDQILMQLMCGSEGVLSVFTELTMRLLPRPLSVTWMIAPFEDIFSIPRAAHEIIGRGMNPTMIELMDRYTLSCCAAQTGSPVQHQDKNHLLIRFDSDDSETLEKLTLKAGDICFKAGACDVLIAGSRADQEKIWKLRSSIHEALITQADSVFEEDVVVPVGKVSRLIENIHNISNANSMRAAVFGHLGDGNMHINFTRGKNAPVTPVEHIRDEVFRTALELGGKLSGEHGIGISKNKFFRKYTDPVYLKRLKEIKKLFDPQGILNPGKLVI